MARDNERKVPRIEPETPRDRAERIKRQYQEELSNRPVIKRQTPIREERVRPDGYRADGGIPRFLRSVQKRMEGSWIFQTFKLPGTNYVVKDMRNAKESEAFRREKEFETKDGKLVKPKEKPYVNFLGDRTVLQPTAKGVQGEISRLLSEFEKLLVERFENGRTLEQELEDGNPHFRKKSEGEWKEFFSKFFKRSVWKSSEMTLLKSLLFRGIVALKKGNGNYAMLIGDLALTNGQVEKFVRMKVLAHLMSELANLKPGSSLEAELLKKGLGDKELRYLALAHKHNARAFKTSMQETKGMFGNLKTEEEVAKKLGLRSKRYGKKGYGGPIKWGEEGASSPEGTFVPIGFWERQTHAGRPKLYTAIFFSTIAIVMLVTVWVIVRLFY